jgi:hypothetical protein
VLVCWCVGVLVCWCVGVLVCWCVGVLVCWCVGVLFAWWVLHARATPKLQLAGGMRCSIRCEETAAPPVAAPQAGNFARAHELYARYLPLMVFEQQPGVAVRKELYRMRGLIESSLVRHPANNISPTLRLALEQQVYPPLPRIPIIAVAANVSDPRRTRHTSPLTQVHRSLPGIDITKPLPSSLFA